MSIQKIGLNIESDVSNRLRFYPKVAPSWTTMSELFLEGDDENILEIFCVNSDSQEAVDWAAQDAELFIYHFSGDSISEVFSSASPVSPSGTKYSFTIDSDLGNFSGATLNAKLEISDGRAYYFTFIVRAQVAQLERQKIRLRFNTENSSTATLDSLTNSTPSSWRASDIQFDVGIFQYGVLVDLSIYSSLELIVKEDSLEGLSESSALMYKSVALANFQECSEEGWNLNREQQVSFSFSKVETALDLQGSRERIFWLLVVGVVPGSPSKEVVLGHSRLRLVEPGYSSSVTPPDPVSRFYTSDVIDAMLEYFTTLPQTVNTYEETPAEGSSYVDFSFADLSLSSPPSFVSPQIFKLNPANPDIFITTLESLTSTSVRVRLSSPVGSSTHKIHLYVGTPAPVLYSLGLVPLMYRDWIAPNGNIIRESINNDTTKNFTDLGPP